MTPLHSQLIAGATHAGTAPADGSRAAALDSMNHAEALEFVLPPSHEAAEPPEARGLTRDAIRLMVSWYGDNQVTHTHFRDLPRFLKSGDVLVINTSATVKAALPATGADGAPLVLHLSTHLPADLWIVEPRQPTGAATRPVSWTCRDARVVLPGGGTATMHVPYRRNRTGSTASERATRLWIATLQLPCPYQEYLARYGAPIRYSHVTRDWPLSYYQTVYATEPGSAEMPSAGRAFTPELLTQLLAHGILVVPLVLHTGVSSLEDHEPPYEEYYRVPLSTARCVNDARTAGRRVVAVGTTVVRALESVIDAEGIVHPGQGWTDVVITPQRGIRAVDALLTGLHEPRSTHLAMLEALAGRAHLHLTYDAALRHHYLWHEFGDLHLLLP